MMNDDSPGQHGGRTGADRSGHPQSPDIRLRTYEFSLRVVKLCRALDDDRLGRVMLPQLLRSGTAIGANVEEAQGAQSKKDFISKRSIARKEALEAHYWLRLIRDCQMLQDARMTAIIDECEEICKVLSASVLSAKRGS